MAPTKRSLENLKRGGSPETEFKAGPKQAEIARQGGIASGKAKSRKKRMRELAQMLGDSTVPEGKLKDALRKQGIDEDSLDWNMAVMAGIKNKAVAGDAKSANLWFEWQAEDESEEDGASDKAVAIMRQNFLPNISSNFGQLTVDVLKHRATHFDVYGGRGSFKSSWASLIGIRLIMENPEIHGLVLRKVANTMRDSVYAQYIWAIGKLGVAEYWEAKKNPLDLIYKPTGQRIMFRGADDPMKIKSIKTPYGYIGYTHFEEKDQFAGRPEIRNILQSTMRGGTIFWNIETYNPPLSRDNWANKDSAEERPGRISHHSTYMDLDEDAKEWLGEEFINEAEILRARDERAWRHEYGGEAVGTGGNVFENLELREITDEEIKRFDRIYQGADWGYFPDPYAFIRVHYDVARETIYFIDEHYANKEVNTTTGQWILDHGYNDVFTTCDSAEPKSVTDYRSMGINAKEAVKGPGSVDYGMKWLQKRKLVIDKRRTPHAYEEFVNYEYEKDRNENWISGYPDANNHSIDALRYAMERVFNKYGNKA